MSLNVAMNSAISGLRATQASIAATSQNTSNIQTEGYTRKSVTQESVPLTGTNSGVRVGKIERAFDQALYREILTQESRAAFHETVSTYLGRLELAQGAPNSEQSVSSRLAKVRDRFEALVTKPESPELQRDVLDAAQAFALTMNSVADAYDKARNDAQREIGQVLQDANGLIQDIAELDATIFRNFGRDSGVADLQDRRDHKIRELAKHIDLNAFERADGTMLIVTRGGAKILDRTPSFLSASLNPLSPSSYYDPTNAGGVAPLRIGDPVTGTDITADVRGGKLGGLLEMRDEVLPRMQAELDELAHKVATRFKGNVTPPQGLPGLTLFTDADGVSIPGDVSGPTDYAPPLTYTGFAARMRLGQRVQDDPTLVRYGDYGPQTVPPAAGSVPPDPIQGSILFLRNVVDHVFGTAGSDGTRHSPFNTQTLGANPRRNLTTTLPSQATLIDFAHQLVNKHAAEAGRANDRHTEAKGVNEELSFRFSNKTGVNLDDEVVQLTVLQRTFAASSRVITTVEQMFDALFSAAR